MKKITGVAFLCGMAFANIPSVLAADATVTFNGTILQETCHVDNNNVNVLLGTYGVAQFPTVGTTTIPVAFSISLTDCPTSGGPTSALVTFSGPADSANNLALTGPAGGISIDIKKADGGDININSQASGITLSNAVSQQLNFTANYISTALPVTAGSANSVAQVNISYM